MGNPFALEFRDCVSHLFKNAVVMPGDGDGLASDLRIIPLLDGRTKCVHIDMNDLPNGHLANHLIPRSRRVRAFAYLSGVWFPKEPDGEKTASTLGFVSTKRSVIHRANGVSIGIEAT